VEKKLATIAELVLACLRGPESVEALERFEAWRLNFLKEV
jgi:hypothetical protein